MVGEGENCPYGDVIESVTECIKASQALGLAYQQEITDDIYPAGCFWHTNDQKSYFNQITDIGSTSPGRFENHGGVCKKEGNQCYQWR